MKKRLRDLMGIRQKKISHAELHTIEIYNHKESETAIFAGTLLNKWHKLKGFYRKKSGKKQDFNTNDLTRDLAIQPGYYHSFINVLYKFVP